ncbi:MAG: hypothetical protein B7Z33_03145 [Sphingomonadales bacterium 12-68-11]|nr:MAG: hypothetical protein B7Z33_03145 [Sphingomonadales bacterium 12-68-11]OYX16853.1 MAG: hypothetical protein B7Z07_01730 [Sphingomonadales bacterium 32-67-7]
MDAIGMSRRKFAIELAALAGAAVAGCGRAAETAAKATSKGDGTAGRADAAMTVYRDPSCGCCEAWAALARDAGYRVTVVDRPDMLAIKTKYGVPTSLSSCHTAVVAGYTLEGHVPLAQVARLIETRPAGIRGLAVPGMPRGSPGMEMPDGTRDAFEVLAFDAAGRSRPFAG